MTRRNSTGFKGRKEWPSRMRALAGCMPKKRNWKSVEKSIGGKTPAVSIP